MARGVDLLVRVSSWIDVSQGNDANLRLEESRVYRIMKGIKENKEMEEVTTA